MGRHVEQGGGQRYVGPLAMRFWKRQARRLFRRLWHERGEDAPRRVPWRGWVTCTALALALPVAAQESPLPGLRATWRHVPTAAEFAALAGEPRHGVAEPFVVCRSAEREDAIADTLDACDAARARLNTADERIDAGEKRIAELEALLAAEHVARLKAEIKANRPQRRVLFGVMGFALGGLAHDVLR